MAIPEWDDRYLEYRPNHRVGLLIRTAIFVPSALLLTGLLVLALMELPSTILIVILLGLGALAVDMEAYHSVRDLMSEPVTSRGRIQRQWRKGRFLFFGRVNYLLVSTRDPQDPDAKPKSRLFEVGAVSAMELQPGDEIEALHWPRTNTIVTLERTARAES